MLNVLHWQNALEQKELLAPSVFDMIASWPGETIGDAFHVAEIDSTNMGAKELSEAYGIDLAHGGNCVIVEAVRGERRQLAACLLSCLCRRADFNGVIRKHLDARRISMAPLEEVLEKTRMEYGSITAVGLPEDWPILIDPRLIDVERLVIGSGLQKSKLSLPGKALLDLPNVGVLEGMCKE